MAQGSGGESVLTRAVRILEVFTPEEPALPVTEIARRASLHVATASRLVAELTGHGLLAREPDGRVRIGVRLWELAFRASPALSLREAAMPYLEDLHAIVGHHVQLGVLDGEQVLFLERLSAPNAVINYTRIAGRLPLHVSSSGVVLLAHADRALQERILAAPLPRYTGATITSPDRLRSLLADVRRQGFVQLNGHVHEEATGIAVPVRDPRGDVVAALSAIVPNDGQGHTRIPVLLAGARGIQRALSSPPPPWSLIG
ncbi:IclR family transcriptional regulator [Geodermatophilus sp. URMC 64]